MSLDGELKVDINWEKVIIGGIELPKTSIYEIMRAYQLRREALKKWEAYNQDDEEMRRKQNPRTLILLALSGGFPVDFKSILIKCLHQSGYKWSEDNNGLVIECDPKITQKYRKHLQSLVKNGRVIKGKQRLVFHSPKFTLEKTYYSLRKRRAG